MGAHRFVCPHGLDVELVTCASCERAAVLGYEPDRTERCAVERAPWLAERLATSWRRALTAEAGCEWRDVLQWLRGLVLAIDHEAARADRQAIADELAWLARLTHDLRGLEAAHGRPLMTGAPPLSVTHRGANP